MPNKINSPYTATITGCGFLYYEFQRMLPLLMAENSEALLKDELENNRIFHVNSRTSRSRFMIEFKRRYAAVPVSFWMQYQQLSESGQRAGLLYAILKCYKLVFDFHFNVTVKLWNSIDHHLNKSNVMMVFSEIAAQDAFVDSWTENTKDRCASQYLTILRQAGLLDGKTGELQALHLEAGDFEYYLRSGEEWFLEACFLYPYEINDIKSRLQ
ncbi:MAG: DUF1819 family protein [Mediterranea sp.]|jgi:hypothetical protein|nr:DUF1819 family protein [Mediterranea sp.]